MRLAQLDRAFGYGPKGRGFESSSARLDRGSQNTVVFLFAGWGGFPKASEKQLKKVKKVVDKPGSR